MGLERRKKGFRWLAADFADEYLSETVMTVSPYATHFVRVLPGRSRPHLFRADDGRLYVVKFANNPQHGWVLAHEWIGGHLGRLCGLPVPMPTIIDVPRELVDRHGLTTRPNGLGEPCESGPCFGSPVARGVVATGHRPKWPIMNTVDLAGMLVFDQWTCNCDVRQILFLRRPGELAGRVTMIDQGECLGGEEHRFPDSPLRGIYHDPAVYELEELASHCKLWVAKLQAIQIDWLLPLLWAMPDSWCPIPTTISATLNRLETRKRRLPDLVRTCLLALLDRARRAIPIRPERVLPAGVLPLAPAAAGVTVDG